MKYVTEKLVYERKLGTVGSRSTYIIIPPLVMQELGIDRGDAMIIRAEENQIIIEKKR